jgi:CheY-like chemotaxis protein
VAASTAAAALLLMPNADIIVTDYALPGGDAVWFLDRVNKDPRPIPSSWSAAMTSAKSHAWRLRPSPRGC